MPLFMVKRKYFVWLQLGKKDVELRAVKAPWKNTQRGDLATILCGREILRMKVKRVVKGSLDKILEEVNYKRIFPQASTMHEAVKAAREIYPDTNEFLAFELEERLS